MEMERARNGTFLSAKRKRKYTIQSERMKCSNPKIDFETMDESGHENRSPKKLNESESESVLSGRRIVELGHLSKELKCNNCERHLNLINTVDERRYGFGSILRVQCECGKMKKVETSKRHRPVGNQRGPPAFDINTKAAVGLKKGMYHSGSGHTQITNFMSAIEVQGLHHKSLKKREKEVEHHIASVADQSCVDALSEEIELQKEKNRM